MEDEILRGVSHWTLHVEGDLQLALRKKDQEIRLRYRFLHDRTKGVHDWSPDKLQKLSSLPRMWNSRIPKSSPILRSLLEGGRSVAMLKQKPKSLKHEAGLSKTDALRATWTADYMKMVLQLRQQLSLKTWKRDHEKIPSILSYFSTEGTQ